jgi:hypothetical protein
MDRLTLEQRLRTDRKRRLFACACVREVWYLLEDERSRRAVEVAEAFADGRATQEELTAAWGAAWLAYIYSGDAAWVVPWAARNTASADALETAIFPTAAAWPATLQEAILLDDIAGPDPLPDLSQARTPTVVALAEAIYQERRWQDLPVLADALEEAGCTDARVLEHLRGPGPHARGCHVLDALLGKE